MNPKLNCLHHELKSFVIDTMDDVLLFFSMIYDFYFIVNVVVTFFSRVTILPASIII
jgi:hypothetical protein